MKIFKKLDFSPTNINLYYQAFTHTSFSNENPSFVSYERLAFLGDAILEFIISEYLYKERHLEEGVMTKMRASYVCEEALATYARDLKFQDDIKVGGCESELGPNDTIMADVFEAFVAALGSLHSPKVCCDRRDLLGNRKNTFPQPHQSDLFSEG